MWNFFVRVSSTWQTKFFLKTNFFDKFYYFHLEISSIVLITLITSFYVLINTIFE